MDNSNINISDLLTQPNIRANGANPLLKRLATMQSRFQSFWPVAARLNGRFKAEMAEGV